jgi:hypothetical protein
VARLKLEVDAETYRRLVDLAVAERRPILWQAEVTLRRAVGLPFPPVAGDVPSTPTRRVASAEAAS